MQNGDLKLYKADMMEDLKNRIVSKLGEVALSKRCESGPVVCNSTNRFNLVDFATQR